MKRIQAPEGVAALMRELYGDFKSGKSSSNNNLFLVNLHLPTEIEKKIIEERKQQRSNNDKSVQSSAAILVMQWMRWASSIEQTEAPQ